LWPRGSVPWTADETRTWRERGRICARPTALDCASGGERSAARGPLFGAPDPPLCTHQRLPRGEPVHGHRLRWAGLCRHAYPNAFSFLSYFVDFVDTFTIAHLTAIMAKLSLVFFYMTISDY
jgi:hypothetical protein